MASTLVQRLCEPAPGQEKLSIHATVAWAGEILAGRKTAGEFVTNGKLSAEESADASIVLTKIAAQKYAPGQGVDANLNLVWRWMLLGEFKGYTLEELHELLGLT